ncbi:MAG: hypothetical protein GW946_02460 [Candidatus Pacebacteria bacterium]|nr:hypothetical protein [Candidatus Paceibacterota bacterium]
MLATSVELPDSGLEWFLEHFRQFFLEFPEITVAANELWMQVLEFLEKSLSTLVSHCGECAIGPLQKDDVNRLVAEVRTSVIELGEDAEQHRILIQIFSKFEQEFLDGQFNSLESNFEERVLQVAGELNKVTIFQLMSTMIAGPESRHRGTNPTIHTARVICEWLLEASSRFTKENLTGENLWSFREELLAVMLHDLGKVLNPRFDGHHKISWTLARESVSALFAHFDLDSRSDDKVNFMISMHDMCGHIAAGRMPYSEVLEDFQRVDEDYMRSLFYVQLSDMRAIKAMPMSHKHENITIWSMLCFDLGFDELIDEMIKKFPQFSDILNRRLSFA